MAGRPKGIPKTGGRQKGTPNKNTSLLKDAILEAAESVGEDGSGKGSLTGYCKFLAVSEPKAFAGLLGRVLPTQIAGDPDNPLEVNMNLTTAERARAFAAFIARTKADR
jgi:hypothetical protein